MTPENGESKPVTRRECDIQHEGMRGTMATINGQISTIFDQLREMQTDQTRNARTGMYQLVGIVLALFLLVVGLIK